MKESNQVHPPGNQGTPIKGTADHRLLTHQLASVGGVVDVCDGGSQQAAGRGRGGAAAPARRQLLRADGLHQLIQIIFDD